MKRSKAYREQLKKLQAHLASCAGIVRKLIAEGRAANPFPADATEAVKQQMNACLYREIRADMEKAGFARKTAETTLSRQGLKTRKRSTGGNPRTGSVLIIGKLDGADTAELREKLDVLSWEELGILRSAINDLYKAAKK